MLLSSLQSIEKVQDESIKFLFDSLANRPSLLTPGAQKLVLECPSMHLLFRYSELKSAEDVQANLKQIETHQQIPHHNLVRQKTMNQDGRRNSFGADFRSKLKSIKSYSISVNDQDDDFETKLKKYESTDMKDILPSPQEAQKIISPSNNKTKGKSFLSRLGSMRMGMSLNNSNAAPAVTADFTAVTSLGIKTFKEQLISDMNEQLPPEDI